jgi:hypothetical protein
MTRRRYTEQSESKKPTETPCAWILLPPAAALRRSDRQPNLVGSRRSIDTLQHKVQIEAELQLSHHDDRRIVATQSNEVTAADLALHVESEGLKEPFDGQIKRSLQDTSS